MSDNKRVLQLRISWDNFESSILSFLRATKTILDDEEAEIYSLDFSGRGKKKVALLDVIVTKEKQLEFEFKNPSSDPLGR